MSGDNPHRTRSSSTPVPKRPFAPRGSAKGWRTKAQKTGAHYLRFLKEHSLTSPSPGNIKSYLLSRLRKGTRRTHSLHCQDPHNCSNDETCPSELAHSTMIAIKKEMRASLPSTVQAFLESEDILDFLATLKSTQSSAGRHLRWAAFLTRDALFEILNAMDTLSASAALLNDSQTYYCWAVTKAAVCLTFNGKGPRSNEILSSLTKHAAISKDASSSSTFVHLNLLDGKVHSSTHHVMAANTSDASSVIDALSNLHEAAENVGLPTGTPLPGVRTSPYVFTAIHSSKLNRDNVVPLLTANGEFRPVTSSFINGYLKIAIREAGLADKYGDFRFTDFRSTTLLHNLETESNLARINSAVGWRANSNLAMHYGRQRQYSAHLEHALASASIVTAADAHILSPLN